MARPTKQGVDYFPFDVDFFQDLKVRKIMKSCGAQSISILIRLLCNIYKDEGYYILWDEDLPFLISDDLVGVTEGAVSEVIMKAIQVKFFDQKQAEENKILTSNGIQKRFKSIIQKRKEVKINELFLVNDGNNSINYDNNSINVGQSTQRKVKESKGNKRRVKEDENPDNSVFDKFKNNLSLDLMSCFNEVVSNQIYLETIAMNNNLGSIEKSTDWLDKFLKQLQNEGVEEKSISDFKSHFGRWLPIQIKRENGEKEKGNNIQNWRGHSQSGGKLIPVGGNSESKKDYTTV